MHSVYLAARFCRNGLPPDGLRQPSLLRAPAFPSASSGRSYVPEDSAPTGPRPSGCGSRLASGALPGSCCPVPLIRSGVLALKSRFQGSAASSAIPAICPSRLREPEPRSYGRFRGAAVPADRASAPIFGLCARLSPCTARCLSSRLVNVPRFGCQILPSLLRSSSRLLYMARPGYLKLAAIHHYKYAKSRYRGHRRIRRRH